MPKLATWIRPRDEEYFRRAFAAHPAVEFWNAAQVDVPMDEMDGLLLTGGPDIAAEFLRQEVLGPIAYSKSTWTRAAMRGSSPRRSRRSRGICRSLRFAKVMQVFNVALGGTLHLDIRGHNAPEMRDNDVQTLRIDRAQRIASKPSTARIIRRLIG